MWCLGLSSFLLTAGPLCGLIFLDGVSPPANTETAPTGPLAGSGWELQLNYINYHATMISPKHVITARHLGASRQILTRPEMFGVSQLETYAIKGGRILIGDTDFSIFEVWETLPGYAQLYQGSDEAGRELVIHGSGVDRGDEVSGAGWRWGAGDSRKSRWGRNVIKGTTTSEGNDFLYFSFDNLPGQDEVMATGGDSGGGWFIQEGGIWKLAAVSFSVDSFYSENTVPADSNGFRGAIFNGSGLSYGRDEIGWQVIPATGESSNPGQIEFYRQSHSYGSRISSRLAEIEAIIAPALAWEQLDHAGRFLGWLTDHGVTTETGVNDDPDGDGLSNLEEYFAESDPSAFSEAEIGMQFEISSPGTHRFSLRESLDLAGRGLTAIIESSQDLNNWNAVGNLVELSSQRLNPEGVRVRILERAGSAEEVRFYRLRLILNP